LANGNEIDTDPGYYSPEGIVTQLVCPAGSYTAVKFKAACDRCSAGKYCYSSSHTVGPIAEDDCPEGHYCPDDTAHYGRYPCAIGTYGAAPRL